MDGVRGALGLAGPESIAMPVTPLVLACVRSGVPESVPPHNVTRALAPLGFTRLLLLKREVVVVVQL